MLAEGRVALSPISTHSISTVLSTITLDVSTITNTGVLLYASEGHIIFSKSTPDSVVQKWQNALNALKTSGEYEKIREQYLLPE